MTDGPPYTLRLTKSMRQWVQEDATLVDEVSAWATDNLRQGWSVNTDTRRETFVVNSRKYGHVVRSYWIEFDDYKDWLLFKLRWFDQ